MLINVSNMLIFILYIWVSTH